MYSARTSESASEVSSIRLTIQFFNSGASSSGKSMVRAGWRGASSLELEGSGFGERSAIRRKS